MPRLSISLLGSFQVTLDDRPVTDLVTDKTRALLAYLAVENDRPHRRESLAGLQWPDQAEQDARRNFRQALFNLRQALSDDEAQPLLCIDRNDVRLNPDADWHVDVDAFARLIEHCDHHYHRRVANCRSCLLRLGQLLKVYRGEFLAGFSLDDSTLFEEWLLLKREWLHGRAVEALTPLDKDETEALSGCTKTLEAKARVVEIVDLVGDAELAFGGSGQTRIPSPYERQLDFVVPLLCVNEDGNLVEFEETFLIEHPWKLSEKNATLAENYNPLKRPMGQVGLVDVAADGRVQTALADREQDQDFIVTLHQQVMALGDAADWTLEYLVGWIDRHIDHQDIPLGESAEFLRKVVRGLLAKYAITDVSLLGLDRFRLRDAVEKRIQQHRASERKAVFQSFLLPDSALTVSNTYALNFKDIVYEPSWRFEGSYQFKKHYFGSKPGELREITAGGDLTEEFRCAQYLDQHPQTDYWARHLARKVKSFRFRTSTDWFYPDFIAQLTDGRVLASDFSTQSRPSAVTTVIRLLV